jgi:ribosomal protein L12E/L44/L45/RPP1/RPP2
VSKDVYDPIDLRLSNGHSKKKSMRLVISRFEMTVKLPVAFLIKSNDCDPHQKKKKKKKKEEEERDEEEGEDKERERKGLQYNVI